MFKYALAFLALAVALRAQTPVVQTTLSAGITASQTTAAVSAALPFQPTFATLTGYAAGTSFSVGDLILYANGSTDLSNASIYATLVAHTGAATFPGDNPKTNWQLVGNVAGIGNWVGSTRYGAGQLAIINSTVIKRIAAGTSRPSYDSLEVQLWTTLGNIQPPGVSVLSFVDAEQIMVLGGGSNAGGPLTISRGANSTSAAVHPAGAIVYIGTPSQFGALTPSGSCTIPGIQYVNTSLLQIYSCVAGTLVSSASNQGSGAATVGVSSPNGNACSNTPVQAPSILFNGTIYTCQSGTYQAVTGTAAGTLTGVTAGVGLSGGGTSGNVPLQLVPPTLSTLGGVQALAPTTHLWLDGISTSGIAHASQPASTDLSDAASIATVVGSQSLTHKNLADGTNVFPTFNQNTTGTAAALAGTPTQCSGQLALGITPSGNANCATIPSILGFTPQNAAAANTNNDALGAAANAQTSAQAYADSVASNASNLTTGTVSTALIPVLNQNTTGQAGTALSLAATPSLCPTGQAPTGILANGSATGCAAIVAGAATPAVSSLLKGNGSANGVVAAVPNTDYLPVASPTITGTATFNGSPLGTLALANAPASGLVASNGTTLGAATASQINSVLGYTPQNAATANSNNAGIGNCTSGLFATGTAAGFTPPCSQVNYSQLAGTNPAAAGAALGLTAVQPTTQQSQFATSIPTSAPYTPCTQGTSPNLTFAGIPYVCSGTAYVANPGPAVGTLAGSTSAYTNGPAANNNVLFTMSGTTGAVTRNAGDAMSDAKSVLNYGVVNDGQLIISNGNHCSITTGTAALTCTGYTWPASATSSPQKVIEVEAAGASGGPLITTIVSTSGTTATLAANASTTVTIADKVWWGTDNCTTLQNAWTQQEGYPGQRAQGALLFPSGVYLYSCVPVNQPNQVTNIQGQGATSVLKYVGTTSASYALTSGNPTGHPSNGFVHDLLISGNANTQYSLGIFGNGPSIVNVTGGSATVACFYIAAGNGKLDHAACNKAAYFTGIWDSGANTPNGYYLDSATQMTIIAPIGSGLTGTALIFHSVDGVIGSEGITITSGQFSGNGTNCNFNATSNSITVISTLFEGLPGSEGSVACQIDGFKNTFIGTQFNSAGAPVNITGYGNEFKSNTGFGNPTLVNIAATATDTLFDHVTGTVAKFTDLASNTRYREIFDSSGTPGLQFPYSQECYPPTNNDKAYVTCDISGSFQAAAAGTITLSPSVFPLAATWKGVFSGAWMKGDATETTGAQIELNDVVTAPIGLTNAATVTVNTSTGKLALTNSGAAQEGFIGHITFSMAKYSSGGTTAGFDQLPFGSRIGSTTSYGILSGLNGRLLLDSSNTTSHSLNLVGNTVSMENADGGTANLAVTNAAATATVPFVESLGKKYTCTHGTNGTCGVVTLTSGTATVSTTNAAVLAAAAGAGDGITLTIQTCVSCGYAAVGTVTAGTGFVINSYSAPGTINTADSSSTVKWEIGHIN